MANMCLYKAVHGDYPKCNGACQTGKNKHCPYYHVDEVCKIISQCEVEPAVIAEVEKMVKEAGE